MNEPLTVEQAASQLHQQRGGSAWAQVAEASERVRQASETADDTADDASPKIYPGGQKDGQHAGAREAADDLLRDRDEKARANPPHSDERIARAKQKLSARVAEQAGLAEADLDSPTWQDDGKSPKRPLESARALAEFRRAKEAGLQQVLAEEDVEVADQEASARATAEWQAQVAQEEQHRAAQEAHQRQTQASQQTQQLSEHQYALRSRLQQYEAAALRELPELPKLVQLAQTNPAAAQQIWADFAARDPAKAQRLVQLDQAHRADAAQAELAAVHHHQHQRQAFQQYAKTQDDAFMAAHPEFSDRRVMWEAQQDAVEYLRDKRGLSEDRLRQLWTSDPAFRSAEAQSIIFDAAKAYRAEKSLREARPVAHPQPQRPGTRNSASGRYRGRA